MRNICGNLQLLNYENILIWQEAKSLLNAISQIFMGIWNLEHYVLPTDLFNQLQEKIQKCLFKI